jgi:steroid delta-isomerase-like uncharacterized protein
MSFGQRYLEAWNSRDGGRVAALMTDDASFEDLAFGVAIRGRQEIADFVMEAARMAPDMSFELVSEQVSDQGYCIEWIWRGSQSGPGAGLPATDKRFEVRGVSVGALENGLVKRNRDYWNLVTLLSQLDLMPHVPTE